MKQLRLFLTGLPVFMTLDLLWLGIVARPLYLRDMGHLLRADVRWDAAVAFYLLFVWGITVFVSQHACAARSLKQAVSRGLLFGLVTYAAFDLTGLAVLKDWPVMLSCIDMAWGACISAVVAGTSVALHRR
jgi:uncharacterized membrane protein